MSRMTSMRKPRNVDLLRLAKWERLVNEGADWMDAWDRVVRDAELGIGRHQGREEPMSPNFLQMTWHRAMERNCPDVLARVTEQAQLSLAGAAGPAVRAVVDIADPDRELTHKDYSSGEKNRLDAAKFVLGSLGVGPDGKSGGPGAAVQVNVSAGGNAEVRDVMSDPELHAEWMALQKKARDRRGRVVDAEVSDGS